MNQPQVYTCALPLEPPSTPSHLPQFHRALALRSLRHTVNAHWVPVLHMVMHVSVLLSQMAPPSPAHSAHEPVLYVHVSFATLQIGSSVPSF